MQGQKGEGRRYFRNRREKVGESKGGVEERKEELRENGRRVELTGKRE